MHFDGSMSVANLKSMLVGARKGTGPKYVVNSGHSRGVLRNPGELSLFGGSQAIPEGF